MSKRRALAGAVACRWAAVHVVSRHRGHIGKGCEAEVNEKYSERGKQRALLEEEAPENGTSALIAAVSGTPDHCNIVIFRGQTCASLSTSISSI